MRNNACNRRILTTHRHAIGVAEWNGREKIRENLRAFIDTGFTAHHDIIEYWDGGLLKVFHVIVTMKPDDSSKPTVRPVMTHFFYMTKKILKSAAGLDR